jgi:hypothetical protein
LENCTTIIDESQLFGSSTDDTGTSGRNFANEVAFSDMRGLKQVFLS